MLLIWTQCELKLRIRVSKGEEKDRGTPIAGKKISKKGSEYRAKAMSMSKTLMFQRERSRKKTVPPVVTNATRTSLSPRGKTSLTSSGQREMCLDKKTSS